MNLICCFYLFPWSIAVTDSDFRCQYFQFEIGVSDHTFICILTWFAVSIRSTAMTLSTDFLAFSFGCCNQKVSRKMNSHSTHLCDNRQRIRASNLSFWTRIRVWFFWIGYGKSLLFRYGIGSEFEIMFPPWLVQSRVWASSLALFECQRQPKTKGFSITNYKANTNVS